MNVRRRFPPHVWMMIRERLGVSGSVHVLERCFRAFDQADRTHHDASHAIFFVVTHKDLECSTVHSDNRLDYIRTVLFPGIIGRMTVSRTHCGLQTLTRYIEFDTKGCITGLARMGRSMSKQLPASQVVKTLRRRLQRFGLNLALLRLRLLCRVVSNPDLCRECALFF